MKTITINSIRDYFVFGTNYTQNNTAEDSVNQLNLNPTTWTDTQILIRKGIHTYPSEIAEWDSVKTLLKSGNITISDSDGNADEADIKAVKAVEKAEKLEEAEKSETKRRQTKKKIMSDLGDSLLEKAMKDNVEQN